MTSFTEGCAGAIKKTSCTEGCAGANEKTSLTEVCAGANGKTSECVRWAQRGLRCTDSTANQGSSKDASCGVRGEWSVDGVARRWCRGEGSVGVGVVAFSRLDVRPQPVRLWGSTCPWIARAHPHQDPLICRRTDGGCTRRDVSWQHARNGTV